MAENYAGKEKREFFRYQHEAPVQYKVLNPAGGKSLSSKLVDAVSKNLSVSGVLFTSSFLPEISSILVLDLDYRTSRICQEIEKRALMVENRMIGKVVRIEESDNGLYDVGVAFVRKTDKLPKGVKNLLK
ncbi:MAG: PilZ domain-containing protein [Candidatus Omnitrophica bacterium]|nr:PilZ domain-containing protein [Candidatus Omnitrophota bacterium]